MSIQTGDTVTIRRGKRKGEQGTVKFVQGSPVATAYVVEFGESDVSLENAANVKAPEQSTITEGDLAAIVGTEAGVAAPGAFDSLIHALDAKLPGFAIRVGLPVASAEWPNEKA